MDEQSDLTGSASRLKTGPSDIPFSIGIGVSNLEASAAFYIDNLGFERGTEYDLGFLKEIVLCFPGHDGGKLVLMNWPEDNDRIYNGDNIKLVFYVDDPVRVIDRVRARGGVIERDADPLELLNNARVGIARDPDNYIIEVLEPHGVS